MLAKKEEEDVLPCDAGFQQQKHFLFVFGQIQQVSGLLAGLLARSLVGWLVFNQQFSYHDPLF